MNIGCWGAVASEQRLLFRRGRPVERGYESCDSFESSGELGLAPARIEARSYLRWGLVPKFAFEVTADVVLASLYNLPFGGRFFLRAGHSLSQDFRSEQHPETPFGLRI